MSVFCSVANVPLFLKALSVLVISKDGFATVIFTPDAMILHVGGKNESMTATAVLPRAVFADYSVSEVRFATHIPTLIDAVTLGSVFATGVSGTPLTLSYSPAHCKLVVQTGKDGESGRSVQSKLNTKPTSDSLLDLHFRDYLMDVQASLRGDVIREAINDIGAAQCVETTLTISPTDGVILKGTGSPYGEVEIHLERNGEAMFSVEGTKRSSTRVHTEHLSLACRAGKSTVRGKTSFGGAAGRDDYLFNTAAGAAPAGTTSFGSGFERVTLQINEQKQLSVIHSQRDNDEKVVVSVVVLPLFDFDSI
ncbi:cell cycle checkpoint protein [Angomonas deanei]|nr:cell cycle checkpoint protein [Angomonas deanei]|eukprot:EPY34110.1 cell cycle checkpoint protein [Angomonas deanei]